MVCIIIYVCISYEFMVGFEIEKIYQRTTWETLSEHIVLLWAHRAVVGTSCCCENIVLMCEHRAVVRTSCGCKNIVLLWAHCAIVNIWKALPCIKHPCQTSCELATLHLIATDAALNVKSNSMAAYLSTLLVSLKAMCFLSFCLFLNSKNASIT